MFVWCVIAILVAVIYGSCDLTEESFPSEFSSSNASTISGLHNTGKLPVALPGDENSRNSGVLRLFQGAKSRVGSFVAQNDSFLFQETDYSFYRTGGRASFHHLLRVPLYLWNQVLLV